MPLPKSVSGPEMAQGLLEVGEERVQAGRRRGAVVVRRVEDV
jgi:hypothetical protein